MPYTWDPFKSAAQLSCLAIADRYDKKARIIGSATYIIPGVFVTATHMLTDFIDTHEGRKEFIEDYFRNDTKISIDLLHIMKVGTLIWSVRSANLLPGSDTVFLICDIYNTTKVKILPDFDKFPYTTINLHPPNPKTKLTSIGFPKTRNTSIGGVKSEHILQMQIETGLAHDMHDNAPMAGRFAYESDIALIGGMSGGPTFNQHGELFAINSASFDPSDNHDAYTSYHSMLFHIMGIHFKLPWDNTDDETTLYKLAKQGLMPIKGLDHLEYINDGYIWRYDIVCKDCTFN